MTKVYRSSDYNALMWVFNQLFHSVQAIKPSSSRQQSAEIFVLCLKYRAPHSIDPKLLDPAYVFQEVGRTDRFRSIDGCRWEVDGIETGVGWLVGGWVGRYCGWVEMLGASHIHTK